VDAYATHMSERQQAFLERFVAACKADPRVVAALIGGSHARGAADAFSDLDLTLFSSDEAYEALIADREEFLRGLGELVFLESFAIPNLVFFIFADGVEGELWLASESSTEHIQSGAYRVLVDKRQLLDDAVFAEPSHAPAEQQEALRRLITWFWHDMSHFLTAIGRGQLWWAHGQLDELQRYCVNLARLAHDFSAPVEGFEKVDQALPIERLAPLRSTCCALERGAMLEAASAIISFYQDLASHLAQAHGLPYPAALERVMLERLRAIMSA
jgi:predicted nucleotidyltransferase